MIKRVLSLLRKVASQRENEKDKNTEEKL